MSGRSSAAFAVALLVVATGSAAARGGEVLRVCLNADLPPWSVHDGAKSGGFDVAVADAVTRRVGQKLVLGGLRPD